MTLAAIPPPALRMIMLSYRTIPLFLMAAAVFVPIAEAEEARLPNVIFVMADDLGYGDLGCFGQKRIKTPHLDRMAAEGMRMTNFYAGSTVCAPSRCVLMTGYHTGHCEIRGNAKQNLKPEAVTVAEVVKSAGYQTALFGKWGLGHEGSDGVPTRQGFDTFFGYLDQHHAHNYYPTFLMDGEERVPLGNVVPPGGPTGVGGDFGTGVATEKNVYSHDVIMDRSLAWIEEQKAKPFFLYLSLTIPHANNEGRENGMEVPDLGEYANTDWPEPQKAHAAMISRMDRDMGRLFSRLRTLELEENTLVIFTSDNGPHREGGNDPEFNNSRGPLRGIKRSLHEGGIRVPTIVRWPGRVEAGSTSDHVAGFQDLMPTLAELTGATDAVPSTIDGISFLPTVLGEGQQADHRWLYWAFYEAGGGEAVRMGRWKAIHQPIGTPLRLYDLEEDLGEEKNVAASYPDVVNSAREAMAKSYKPSEQWAFPKPKSNGPKPRPKADTASAPG